MIKIIFLIKYLNIIIINIYKNYLNAIIIFFYLNLYIHNNFQFVLNK